MVMAPESIAHSAFGLMGYWVRAHLGSRNNCYLYPCEIELIFTVLQDVQTIQTFEKNLNKSNVWKQVKCQIEHEFEGNQVYFIQVHQFDDMWLQFLHSKRKNIRFKIPQRFKGFSLGKKTLWCHFIVGVLDWLTYW